MSKSSQALKGRKKRRPASTPQGKDMTTGKGEHVILDAVADAGNFKKAAPTIEKLKSTSDNVK